MLSSDPIVTVDTNFGNFQIELRPDAAPNTVADFLNYVESGAYTNSIFHRSVPGFVEQAGGFTSSSPTFTSTSQFATIPTNSPVNLEYKLPNVVGSVAMARTSNPNSATDEWFVNLVDNSTTLGPGGSDASGYTVFGQVLGNGMQVLDAIAALNVDNADNGGVFSQLPLGPNNELVRISSVTIDSIDGTVFSDTNGNGQLDTGEQGVAGRTMFVDLNATGTFQAGDPTATTDSSGHYSFSGITPGTYKVYEELPTGISLTMPSQSVTVTANNTTSGVNFAEEPSIKGTVFTDTTGSGTLQSGETGVAGQTVFLNNDNTGAPDANNPSTVTDANGNYSFSDLAAGTYKVDVVAPSGTTITTSSLSAAVSPGGAAQIINIGEEPASIAGTVFTDVNGTGKFDTGDIGIAGRTVFINKDNSGTADGTNPQTTTNSVGQFSFSGLAPGSYTVEEVLPTGGTLTTPAQTVTVTAGTTASGVVFGELPSISGNVFVDLNGNSTLDSGEPGVAGQIVFLNVDGSGKADGTNPQTTTDSSGNFAFGTEPAGSYTVEMVAPNNVTLSTPAQTITVTTGKTTTGANLGELPSITGEVFTDTNGNGALDSGEKGVSGRTVFLNNDGSGVPDSSNPSATTDANGHYYFLGLAPGSYTVTEVAASGVTLSTSPQKVTVTAGQITSSINIGEKSGSGSSTSGSNTGTISGTVFTDYDLSGHYVSSDPGIGGRTVFLDNDGSGVPDSSNPSTTTDSSGNYSFTGLAAGNYKVMEVIPSNNGITLTTKLQAVSVAAGGTTSGVDLGNAVTSTLVPVQVSTSDPPAATDANTAFIDAVYQTLLGHAPDPAGLTYWQQQMSGGASRATMVQGVWDSQEHRTDEVNQFYEEFLGRPSDPAGLSFWIAAFNSWGTEQIEVEGFLTSTEFLTKNQGSNAFVNALYNDVVQRSPASAEVNYWVGQLNGGQTPLQVATAFVFGQEASTAVVDGFYADFLHRAPGSDLQTWVNDLTSKTLNGEQVGEQILASQEFYKDVTGNKAPVFTSGASTTFMGGAPGTFSVTTSGMPAGKLSESGNLPSGVTFTDNGNGTATLAGTPSAGGTFALTLTANNGIGTAATQNFALTVDAAPTITSAASTTFTNSTAGTFTVTTSGTPTAKLTESGSLPSGVTFTDNGDGTATLAGTPAASVSGAFPITITASNGTQPDATQSFTLTVHSSSASTNNTSPTITSAASTLFTEGTAGTFNVTTTGSPTPTLTEAGNLPSGVTFTDNGNGTATLAGTPASGTAGTYTITINASEGSSTVNSQTFTLTVGSATSAPQFTNANSTTFAVGSPGTFSFSASGSPTPALTETGSLPSGVTFTDNGNGTAMLTGTPAASSAGIYTLTVAAKNGTQPDASQAFTLNVLAGTSGAPTITSADSASFTSGTAGTFTISTTGTPTPAISETGTLPTGVTLTDNGDGTATLASTASAAAGTYQFSINASNGVGGGASQPFTLTIS